MPMPTDRTAGWEPDPLNAECPSREVVGLIADKWSILVLTAIDRGAHRNGQMMRAVEGISQKALTRTLRELERSGLVDRHDHHEVPPRVDYALTSTGASIIPLLSSLCAWSIAHMNDVLAARSRHLNPAPHGLGEMPVHTL